MILKKSPAPELPGRPRVKLVAAMPPVPIAISPPVTSAVPAGPAWDEAFLRVESYLRAHHLESRVLLNQLATDIIREARERALEIPGEAPVSVAMQVTHARIGVWFARAGNAGDWSEERVRVRGRLALVLAELPGHRADYFLAAGPLPPGLAAALAGGLLQPGPKLRFSNMPPAPLAFGFDDPGDPYARKPGGWGPGMLAAAGWLSLAGLYGVLWAAAH